MDGGGCALTAQPGSAADAILDTFNSTTGPVLMMGPLTLTMSCVNGGSIQSMSVDASTTAADASAGFGLSGSTSPNAVGGVTNMGESPTGVITRNASGFGDAGGGELVYRDPSTTITLSLRYFVSPQFGTCQVFGVAVQS
jgi:hypothetical protein